MLFWYHAFMARLYIRFVRMCNKLTGLCLWFADCSQRLGKRFDRAVEPHYQAMQKRRDELAKKIEELH